MSTILKAENISKQYRLGKVGTGTLGDDLKRWWYHLRGKEDPFLKVGGVNDRSAKATEDYIWALRDINFEVKQGEVLGIIGKNGAGKSTLLKLLSRVTAPTTGSIKTKGRIASLLEIGTGFHPELTGRENIFMNGAVLGMTKAEIKTKLDEIIAFSGCEMYIDTPVKRYSSGMTVRLGFAVAAHLEPEILVVDEVLAVGDAEFQKKAIGKMNSLSKGEGRTVLFVSHNMASVKSLCTKGIVLANGAIVFKGNQNDAVENYLIDDMETSISKKSLLYRTDRIGSQKIKISNVDFFNNSNHPIRNVISGTFLMIRVHLKKIQTIKYEKLYIAINFLDENQNFVLSYSSDEMGASFENLKFKNYFDLVIPNLYLRSGNYRLRILITEFDTRPENFVDLIENAVTLNVLPGDIWRVGKANRGGSTVVLPGCFNV